MTSDASRYQCTTHGDLTECSERQASHLTSHRRL